MVGRMKRTALLLTLPLAVLSADTPAPATKEVVVTKDTAFSFYHDYRRMTREPYMVDGWIAALCRDATDDVEKAKKRDGPHLFATVQIYMNEAAGKALDAKSPVYPEGAVIVKEKLGKNNEPIALGGMLKRAKGFDPEHGDWEYFYAEKGGSFTTGKMENCIECHEAGAKSHDYVFGKWQKPQH
jgi:hypothetical protein